MNTQSQNYNSQKVALLCNYVFVFFTAVGWLGIANFIQPAPADLGLENTKIWFGETYQLRVLLGCTLFYIAAGFLVPGSIMFGIMFAKIEGKWPVWSLVTATCGLFVSIIIFFNSCSWIVSAYRSETGADVVQALNDWSWMAFLLGWFYLAIEMLGSAIVEFQDKREKPMIPRWMTWLTLLGSLLLVGAAGPAFTKSGPFAYHGFLAFYMPVIIWGSYIVGTTWFMYKNLLIEEKLET